MRTTLFVMAVLAIVSAANGGNLITNGTFDTGDESGWTRWTAGRGTVHWDITGDTSAAPEGKLSASTGGYPSFGWYQIVQAAAGTPLKLSGQWSLSNPGWAEIDFKTYSSLPSDATIKNDLDANIKTADVAWKCNGMTGKTAGYPELVNVGNIGFTGGNGGVLTSKGYAVVLLKLGGMQGQGDTTTAYFDNITLTPEPASLALLLLAAPLLSRRTRR